MSAPARRAGLARIFVSALLSILLGPGLCLDAASQPAGFVVLGAADDGKTIQVTGAQQIALRLPAQPSTGRVWVVSAPASRYVREIGERRFEPLANHAPGRAGFTWQNLRPVADGAFALVMELRGPAPESVVLQRLAFHVVARAVAPVATAESPLGFVYTGDLAKPPSSLLQHKASQRLDACAYTGGKAVNLCANGRCTPVKYQGECGACWVFAGNAVVENTIRQADWVTRNLSEQYVVSCGAAGYCDAVFYFGEVLDYYVDKYLPAKGERAPGVVYAADFPYSAGNFPTNPVKVPCNGPHEHHERLVSWDQAGGLTAASHTCIKALLSQGYHLMTFADATNWHSYAGGVRQGASLAIATHTVVIVGFDDAQGVWIIRNSWGAGWGESADGKPASGGNGGYMRIRYGGDAVGHDIAWVTYAPNPALKASLILSALRF